MFFTTRSGVKKFIAPTHREIDVHNQNKFIKRKIIMTPKEIIEALEEYFKEKMDEKIDLNELAFALLDAGDCKESIIEELDYWTVNGIRY